MQLKQSRRLLQAAVVLASFVPILAGLAGILCGPAMTGGADVISVSTDSHFRYLSGLLAGIGLGFWSTIPHIEVKTQRFQTLAAIVLMGGLGRLTSLWVSGVPRSGMIFGLAMELAVTPLLALWQWKVALSSQKSAVKR